MRRLTNVTLVLFILLNLVFVTSSASAAPERADRGPWAPNVSYGGLNQPASGAAPGAYEPGIQDYKLLVAQFHQLVPWQALRRSMVELRYSQYDCW